MSVSRTILSAVGDYVTGAPGKASVAWIAAGTHADPESLPRDAVVIIDSADTLNSRLPHRILHRSGELDEDCELLVLDEDIVVSVMGYALSNYVPCTGACLLRLASHEDWHVFLADADAAVNTGILPEQLLSPGVLLEDEHILGTDVAPLSRVTISARGRDHHLPGIGSDMRERDTGSRRWLPRYLTLVSTLRTYRLREPETTEVSGLGMRLSPISPPEPVESPHSPVLVSTRRGLRCVLPATGRHLAVPRLLGTAVELLWTHRINPGDLGDALGLTAGRAQEVLARLARAGLLERDEEPALMRG